MTAPEQFPLRGRRVAPAAVGSTSDSLVEELRGRLPALAEQVLDELEPQLARDFPAADPRALRADVVKRVAEDGLALLSDTNNQIAQLRRARKALAAQDDPTVPPADGPDRRDKVAHAALGAAMWVGVISPLVFWQLLQLPLSSAAHFWVSVAVVVGGLVLLWPAKVAVARAGRRLGGRLARGGAGWPWVVGFPTVYLMSLWRLGSSSREDVGTFWAYVIWISAALVTAFLTAIAYFATTTPEPGETEGHRIPRSVVGREWVVTLAAFAVFAPLLTGVVPVPGPEWVAWLAADVLSLLVMVLGGPLALGWAVPARFSRDETRRGSRGWTQQRARLSGELAAAEHAWREAAEEPVRQWVLQHINAMRNPPFGTRLPAYDRAALGQMRAGDRIVKNTAAGKRLESVLAGISGGAIGVAGPRGAGKSTWLEAYRDRRLLDVDSAHIALLESVPVRYDVREFVLYLYARMCSAVVAFCDERGVDTAERPDPWPGWRARLRRWWPSVAIVAAWLVLGIAGSAWLRDPKADIRAWLSSLWWPLVSLLTVGGLLAVAVRHRPATPSAAPPAWQVKQGRPRVDGLPALRRLAVDRLEAIEFQQKHTAGWSGKVGVLVGGEVGLSGSRELTRQPRTYPQIVRDFSDFLDATIDCVAREPNVATPSVVIILDELDKIASPEAAQDFVNEVKALFDLDVPGFLLLVSVSEDALASFERRGLPVRDAFDSAFDIIFRLEYLTLDDARQVLNNRIVALPEPFVCLCHCLAGGLPRELIRVARQMISDSGSLRAVSRRLVGDDLRDKRGALRTVVARGAYDDVLVSELVRHVDAHIVADAEVLLHAVRRPPITVGLAAEPDPLSRLQLETLGYLYYLGTVLEVFDDGFSPADLERGHTEGDASFDTLSSVRQLFPVNARLAWLTVSAFRQAWKLETVPPPGTAEGQRVDGRAT
ncbi:transcriptional regulator [Amycolatopsis sp. cmx-4-61]|uniref:transcriptional regulator n=1 Tax=Amycolatopsis sp. cmx-4-61 TaxID=2790937 RepID=UPI003978DB0B